MNQFLIYYSRSNDQLKRVATYHKRAADRARLKEKIVHIAEIDVDNADEEQTKYWNGDTTIECVTVRDTTKVDSAINPTLQRVDEMIDNL